MTQLWAVIVIQLAVSLYLVFKLYAMKKDVEDAFVVIGYILVKSGLYQEEKQDL